MVFNIFRNWQAKVGSLLLAIALYINLQTQKITSKTYEIPISYPKLSQNLYYDVKRKKTYKVKLEGFKDLIKLHFQYLKLVIEPEDLHSGQNLIEVKQFKFEGLPPNGIKIIPLDGKLKVNVDTLESRTIPVEVIFEDQPPANYSRSSYKVSPNSIVISGPKQIIEKWNRYTPKISLRDQRESFARKFRISLPRSLKLVSKKKEVIIRVGIVKTSTGVPEPGEQVVVGIPVKCRNVSKDLSVSLAKSTVSLKFYSPNTLNSIQIIKGVKVWLNCKHSYDKKKSRIKPAATGYHKVNVSKSAEVANIDIIDTIPEKIKVSYKKKATKTNDDFPLTPDKENGSNGKNNIDPEPPESTPNP
ncbi:MAG: CdaR family protein [Spirochaetota bacterium]